MIAVWRQHHTPFTRAVSCYSAWRYAIRFQPFSSSAASSSSSSSSSRPVSASDELRQLMRKVAQPVAVITANLHDAHDVVAPDHGATISSFVSIALHPTPLVAFALRLPSRLATFLNSTSSSKRYPDHQPTFKIHLLSEAQEDEARAFARQAPLPDKVSPSEDKAPSPSTSSSLSSAFSMQLFQSLEASSLGSLECSIAGELPLLEPLFPKNTEKKIKASTEMLDSTEGILEATTPGQATSQLFIARVLKVNTGDISRHPLLYYHQKYCVLDMD